MTPLEPRDIIPVRPSKTLAQRLQHLGLGLGFSQIAEELDPVLTVAHTFQQPQDPFSPHLDVIVQIPPSSKWKDMNSHDRSADLYQLHRMNPLPSDSVWRMTPVPPSNVLMINIWRG